MLASDIQWIRLIRASWLANEDLVETWDSPFFVQSLFEEWELGLLSPFIRRRHDSSLPLISDISFPWRLGSLVLHPKVSARCGLQHGQRIDTVGPAEVFGFTVTPGIVGQLVAAKHIKAMVVGELSCSLRVHPFRGVLGLQKTTSTMSVFQNKIHGLQSADRDSLTLSCRLPLKPMLLHWAANLVVLTNRVSGRSPLAISAACSC